ncbi:hypothetical protein [Bradyrhizobium liaoningense]|uniref:hypothetical protein n=1 Tax=Bradyrhizobium liaoningense TaxID=43992 RepID=UPI001BAC6288|nr:hypothetical protein [Bradyrhizobium liaoningense]MBR0906491.1 hypothetical protein [Bradyrhizobium liaoningense]
MSDSNADLRDICLREAKDADPERAEFLRQLARNYEAAERSEPDGFSISHVLIVGLAIYVFCLPVLWLVSCSYEPSQTPKGAIVEQIGRFTEAADGRYVARTFMFGPKIEFRSGRREWNFSEEETPVIYEDTHPLPASHYEFQELNPRNIWRFVTIKTSDGSDPRNNGRRYYAVLPD